MLAEENLKTYHKIGGRNHVKFLTELKLFVPQERRVCRTTSAPAHHQIRAVDSLSGSRVDPGLQLPEGIAGKA